MAVPVASTGGRSKPRLRAVTGGGPQLDTQREALAEAVMAGPGSALTWDDDAQPAGLLKRLAGGGMVARALAETDHDCKYANNALNGAAALLCVLAGCLFSGLGYNSLLSLMVSLPGLITGRAPGRKTLTGSALSLARARLGEAPLRRLFELVAVGGQVLGPGSMWKGMELTAYDGSTIECFNDPGLAAEFGVPTGGKHPLVRLVTLISCGSRRILAAAAGGYHDSEQALAGELINALRPGTLNTADRNFFSMARWIAAAATGAALVWRVKNGAKSVPFKVIKTLPDGSQLVRIGESDGMRARRRAQIGDPAAPQLPDVIARLVEFGLLTTTERGKKKISRFRLLTTLLDHQTYPARQVAQVYAERWSAEISYLHLKNTLRGSGRVLRGRSVPLARQEIWAYLIVYNMLCDLATQAAALDSADPDQISIIAVLHLLRDRVTADTCCPHCGKHATGAAEAIAALVAAIAAHPKNRTDRQRTGPRTKAQRRTGHTENVDYTITIIPSNLTKLDRNPKT
jgi:hypothetical protein